jgi:hypothetical protein
MNRGGITIYGDLSLTSDGLIDSIMSSGGWSKADIEGDFYLGFRIIMQEK